MLVYTPAKPAIHYLNPLAWLVFEICDGRSYTEVLEVFLRTNAERIPTNEARRRLDSALEQLVADGLVLRSAGPGSTHQEPGGR